MRQVGNKIDMDMEKAQIGARLRSARIRAHVTQEDAAQAAGVNRTTLGNWEAGRHMPCLVQFRDLMERYGESPYRVLFGRSMFGFSDEDIAEISRESRRFSPSLQRRIELMIAVQVRADTDDAASS